MISEWEAYHWTWTLCLFVNTVSEYKKLRCAMLNMHW